MTDAEVKTVLSERDVVALTLWAEARSEPVEGRIAVGNVIRNRVKAKRFSKTYRGVCHARWQFSCWEPKGGLSNYEAVMNAARSLLAKEPAPPILRECQYLAVGVIDDVLLDNTKRATHYLTRGLFASQPPAWARGQTPVADIGTHLFFAGIA